MRIATANGCAWRALYVYIDTPRRLLHGGVDTKVFHLGVDPNDGIKPALFGSLLGCDFRIPLPTVRWTGGMGPLRLALYKRVRWFWHMVDGRYGWGSSR